MLNHTKLMLLIALLSSSVTGYADLMEFPESSTNLTDLQIFDQRLYNSYVAVLPDEATFDIETGE